MIVALLLLALAVPVWGQEIRPDFQWLSRIRAQSVESCQVTLSYWLAENAKKQQAIDRMSKEIGDLKAANAGEPKQDADEATN